MIRLRVWIAILTIFIISFSSFAILDISNYDIGEPLALNNANSDENVRHNLVSSVKTRTVRDVWTDNFETDVLIEDLINVVLINKTVELGTHSINFTSTSDFDAGNKTGTVTETDEFQVPPGQIQIESPSYEKDSSLELFLPMNEGSGSTVYDETVNQNDGTINGPTWINGKFGNALDFDGTDDYLKITTNDFKNQLFSVQAWIKTTDDLGNIIDYEHGVGYYGWKFRINPNGIVSLQLTRNNGGLIASVDSLSTINDDKWHYVVGTNDGTNLRIYIDGILDNSASSGTAVWTGTMYSYIGAVRPESAFKGSYFKGIIDEVKVFDRALTLQEIQVYYNSGKRYDTSGVWESAPVELNNEYLLSSTSLKFIDVLAGKSKIDRIEWLESNSVIANYEKDIVNPAKSPLIITDSDLTSGSFKSFINNFTIKIYFKGDGRHTPVLTSIICNLRYLKGHIISKQITLNQNYRWDSIMLSKAIIAGTEMKVSVLDGVTGEIIPGFDNFTETFINLSSLDSKKYPIIKLRADLHGNPEFSPKLNQWTVSWIEDYPVLDPEIPSNNTLPEDSNAKYLIDLGNYFYDYYDSLKNLTFKITYQSNSKHLEAKVKDGHYLSFFTKKQDWTGSESFKVSCSDTGGLKIVSNKFDVTVTPVDDPPIWSKNLPDLKMDEDTKTENWLDMDNYVSDVEEDYLDFAVVNISNPGNINITINSDNKVSVFPTQNFYGTISVTIQVFEGDNESLYANNTFDIIVYPTNDPPTIPEIPDQTAKEDKWLNITITANDSDPDDKHKFYSNITKNNLWLNSDTGNLSFLPTNDDVGIMYVNITVEDIEQMKGFNQFKITVKNKNDPPDDPKIESPKNEDVFKVNDQIEFVAEVCSDIDKGDVINYSWDFDLSNGIGKDRIGQEVNYTFKSTGRYIVTLTVTDSTKQKSTTIVVNITSTGIPVGPNGPDGTSKKSDDLSAWINSVILIVIIIILVIIAFLVYLNKKRSVFKEYLKEIEGAYDWARTNPAIGKEKLTNLKLRLSNDLKNGVLSKEDYVNLENKLNDYISILTKQRPIGVIPSAIPAGKPLSVLPSVTPTSVSSSQPTPITRPQIAPSQPKPTPQLPPHTTTPGPMPTQTPIPVPVPKPKSLVQPIQPITPPTTFPKPTAVTKKEVVKCFNCGNLVTVTKTSGDEPTILHCPKCGTEGTID